MNSSIYIKLAATNIKNNRKTYVPYVFTAVLTVMMYYIMDSLSRNESVGDGNLQLILKYAVVIIIIFAVIFLFYTNSFLIKRRKKEIGVYNILGMGKGHLGKMLAVEMLFTAVTSIGAGLLFGTIFSRLMWLILLKILHHDVGMKYEISGISLGNTLILFSIILMVTLLYNLLQIRLSNPIELLHGSSQGEKEPKTKWLLTFFGVLSLGAGYYIALTTESPLEAITAFFVAVICVVLGTYALFVAGSIAFLKMMRKNKNYYYKMKHFTAVSGMIYRMKQNAVGLANICILSTMVLVMISTSVSLYVGMEDVLKTRFPYEFTVVKYETNAEDEQKIDKIITDEAKKNEVNIKGNYNYHYASITAIKSGIGFSLNGAGDYKNSEVCELYLIPQEDYNRMEEEHISLAQDEVVLYTTNQKMYGRNTVRIEDKQYQVLKELEDMKVETKSGSRVTDAYYLILSDEDQMTELLQYAFRNSDMQEEWKPQMCAIKYRQSFDFSGKEENCKKAAEVIRSRIENEVTDTLCESRELSRNNFYSLYGGLLFIGIYLGLLFLMATVLIIYYKQISEGYDDKERYQIMQKVGMSKKEVKNSIRSQVLTVFFLPLIVAIIHIAVAFKVITKLLAVLNLVNVPLFFGCTIATVAVFALFYGIVFSITAREYYKIVN